MRLKIDLSYLSEVFFLLRNNFTDSIVDSPVTIKPEDIRAVYAWPVSGESIRLIGIRIKCASLKRFHNLATRFSIGSRLFIMVIDKSNVSSIMVMCASHVATPCQNLSGLFHAKALKILYARVSPRTD